MAQSAKSYSEMNTSEQFAHKLSRLRDAVFFWRDKLHENRQNIEKLEKELEIKKDSSPVIARELKMAEGNLDVALSEYRTSRWIHLQGVEEVENSDVTPA